MLLLSPKAKRLIDSAVSQLADEKQREDWTAWTLAHPRARNPATAADDPGEPIPVGVAAVALTALDRKAAALKDRLGSPALDEDEQADLENDLTFIGNVEGLLIKSLGDCSRRAA